MCLDLEKIGCDRIYRQTKRHDSDPIRVPFIHQINATLKT